MNKKYRLFQLIESNFTGKDENYSEIILLKIFSSGNIGFEKVKQNNIDTGKRSRLG